METERSTDGQKPLLRESESLFPSADVRALTGLIRRVARRGMRVAEVGSWVGTGSTQVFLAELSKIPGLTLTCIDTWHGNANHSGMQEIDAKYDLFGSFLANIERAHAKTTVIPVRAASVAAASLIADATYDLVFIDADHSYAGASGDIKAWLPKVKPGGVLCGHDCEARPTKETRLLFEKSKSLDTIRIVGARFLDSHPGVILAVDEAFTGAASLFTEEQLPSDQMAIGPSSIWHVTVTQSRVPRFPIKARTFLSTFKFPKSDRLVPRQLPSKLVAYREIRQVSRCYGTDDAWQALGMRGYQTPGSQAECRLSFGSRRRGPT
jgi:Methyltransferase domain